jgi:hypothetical protein
VSPAIARKNGKDSLRPDQAGGLLLEGRAIHPGELRPPLRGMRPVEIFVEHQHELRLLGFVLAQAIAQQRKGAGGLADGGGPRVFVPDRLSDLLVHEVDEVEDEGDEFGAAGGCCHDGFLRRFGFDAGGVAAEGFTWVSLPKDF